jgi:hypothetical protein
MHLSNAVKLHETLSFFRGVPAVGDLQVRESDDHLQLAVLHRVPRHVAQDLAILRHLISGAGVMILKSFCFIKKLRKVCNCDLNFSILGKKKHISLARLKLRTHKLHFLRVETIPRKPCLWGSI